MVRPTIYPELWKTDGFMPLSIASGQRQTLSASSRTWTMVADFISFDNNYYTCRVCLRTLSLTLPPLPLALSPLCPHSLSPLSLPTLSSLSLPLSLSILSLPLFPSLSPLLLLSLCFGVHMCIPMCIYPTSPHGQDVTQGQFLRLFHRFKFRGFLLLEWLPHQG